MPRRSLGDAVAVFEKDLIQDALKTARGNRAQAARLLDTTERIIGYKIRKLRHRPRTLPLSATLGRGPSRRFPQE